MLYYKCPTCGTILANKQIPFEQGMLKICNNEKLTEKQKEIEKKKLLDELYILNVCCRMRMLTYIKLIDIIL